MSYDSIGDHDTLRPGATPRAPALTPGTMIGGRFEVVRLLGRGGMGEVHLCRDTKVGRDVAIKFLRLDLVADAPLLERFRREARAVGQLAHAHIVTLYDYEVDAAGAYLVMELLRGVDLAAHVRANGPLPAAEVRRIALQVLDALEYAHARQIVHRDIKPSNVFVQDGGLIKVLDFGLARSAGDASLSMMGAGLGTADYVAPEQAEDATKADARSDQFSLGATLYFMLTGKSPRVVRERDIPEVWRELVLRMLEQEPGERYGDLGAVRVGLQKLAFGDRKPSVAASVVAAPTVAAVVQPKPVVPSDVSSWAEVLKASVDRSIVTDARLADQITAVGLPWRVYDRVTGIEMVLIPPGSYMRGASDDDEEADDDERPRHEVILSRAFYLAVFPITQREWTNLVGSNPSYFNDSGRFPVGRVSWDASQLFLKKYYDDKPVEQVSWDDSQVFLRGSFGLRLPTEGEWEYACRAGTTRLRYGALDKVAWFAHNSGKELIDACRLHVVSDQKYSSTLQENHNSTRPVGMKAANAFGLHDMLGNVWEWCADWYGNYLSSSQADPQGPSTGDSRVLRGGSWNYSGRSCRASSRSNCAPADGGSNIGFRAARTP